MSKTPCYARDQFTSVCNLGRSGPHWSMRSHEISRLNEYFSMGFVLLESCASVSCPNFTKWGFPVDLLSQNEQFRKVLQIYKNPYPPNRIRRTSKSKSMFFFGKFRHSRGSDLPKKSNYSPKGPVGSEISRDRNKGHVLSEIC